MTRLTFCAWLIVLSAGARAENQLVPELNAFINLSERARIFLLADATHFSGSREADGELGIHVDYTLKPFLRPHLHKANWERDRYLWMRLGYQRADNLKGNPDAAAENRVILELTARGELAGDAWLVGRLRLDLRDLDGSHSQRYRFRIGAEKEFLTSSGRALVPYAQAEWFYDTRFDALSRRLYQAGIEVALDKSWRLEPYYAHEQDTRPSRNGKNRIGLVLKYFH